MRVEIRDLRQFKEWAEPQIITHGADVLTIAQLRHALKEAKGMIGALCMTAKRSKYTDSFWQSIDDFLKSSSQDREECK